MGDGLRLAAKDGHFVNIVVASDLLVGAIEINVVAVARERQTAEKFFVRWKHLNIAAGFNLANVEAFFACVREHIDNILAVRRNSYGGGFARLGQRGDAHVLNVQDGLVGSEFIDRESDGGDADKRGDQRWHQPLIFGRSYRSCGGTSSDERGAGLRGNRSAAGTCNRLRVGSYKLRG